MRYFSTIFLKQALMLIVLLLSLALVGCSKNSGDDGGRDDCDGDQACDNLVTLKVNLSNSAGLLTTDSTGTARMHRKNARYLGIEPN